MEDASSRTYTFRLPPGEMAEFDRIVSARGYTWAQAMRVLVRRVVRGSITMAGRSDDGDVRRVSEAQA